MLQLLSIRKCSRYLSTLAAFAIMLMFIEQAEAQSTTGTYGGDNGGLNITSFVKKNVTVTVRAEASYPADYFTYAQIKGGAVVLYLFGM